MFKGRPTILAPDVRAPNGGLNERRDSVTRFGAISPLWQNFNSLWVFLASLFRFRQNIEPNLGNIFMLFWANLVVIIVQILNNQCSHLVTLVVSETMISECVRQREKQF